jgi:hypothetical protein
MVHGRKKVVACGRPRCSLECRCKWARRMAACVLRSARELPPTHEARVTAFGMADDRELTVAHGRFFRRLRENRIEYLAVNEWKRGRRHLHVLLRAGSGVTARQVRKWWRASLPRGARATSHCAPIRDVTAFVRYVFKDIHVGGELPDPGFAGKIYTASRSYLVRRLDVLWKEERAEWDRSRRSKGMAGEWKGQTIGFFCLSGVTC